MTDDPPVFSLKNVTKLRTSGGGTFELHVPQLTVRPGDILVLRGASGSGKSTLLDLLAMTLRPDRAAAFEFAAGNGAAADVRALWREDDIDGLTRLRAAHIGYVLQTGGLLSFLTVRDNIALSSRLLGRSTVDGLERLAERLGIVECLDRLPRTLSVGERQRVAIARAIAHRPRVVLADEPTASVDPINAEVIFKLFIDLVRRFGVTALIASHDWQRVEEAGLPTLEHRIERNGPVTRALFWN